MEIGDAEDIEILEQDDEDDVSFTANDVIFMKITFQRIFFPIMFGISKGSPSLLCYDGDYPQIEATFMNLINVANQLNIELLKFPASTTMLYQPNDLMRSHCLIHKYVRSSKYVAGDIAGQIIPLWMDRAEVAMKRNGIAAASLKTFKKFLFHITAIIGSAFTRTNIISGWESSGIYPLDHLKTLNKIRVWETLDNSTANTVLMAIDALIEDAKVDGVVTDEQIRDKLGDAPLFNQAISSTAINAQRALWMNKEGVLLLRAQQEQARREKELQAEAAQQRKAQKQAAQQLRNEAIAASVEGILVSEEPDAIRENNLIICARTKCNDYLTLPHDTPGNWKTCTKCRACWYCCRLKSCRDEAAEHVRKCHFNISLQNEVQRENSILIQRTSR